MSIIHSMTNHNEASNIRQDDQVKEFPEKRSKLKSKTHTHQILGPPLVLSNRFPLLGTIKNRTVYKIYHV